MLSRACPLHHVTSCATELRGAAVLAGAHLLCSCSRCIRRIWHRSRCTSSSMWPWGGGDIGGDIGGDNRETLHGLSASGLAPGSSPSLPSTDMWLAGAAHQCPQFPHSRVPISPAPHRAGGSGTASPPYCAASLSPARERAGLSTGLGACGAQNPPGDGHKPPGTHHQLLLQRTDPGLERSGVGG